MPPHDAQTWFEKGQEALRMSIVADGSEERCGYLSQAIAALWQATLPAPEHVEAWSLLGRALVALADEGSTHPREKPDILSQAVVAFDTVTRLGRRGALYLKADMLSRLRLHPEALETWDAILQSEGAPSGDSLPNDWRFQARVERAGAGIIDAMLGRYAEARLAWLEGTQDEAEAWRTIGHALAKARQHADALVAFETAILLNPDDPDAWSGKGDALFLCGRTEEARPAYDESNRLRDLRTGSG